MFIITHLCHSNVPWPGCEYVSGLAAPKGCAGLLKSSSTCKKGVLQTLNHTLLYPGWEA